MPFMPSIHHLPVVVERVGGDAGCRAPAVSPILPRKDSLGVPPDSSR